eukprot:CAMPEP_0170464772 /NCGR_PEP_ID=MMETSP0123-20130129/9364_1 /TAXON_ID=182087 /ORGANISM="Favella ehrenbergii, Strain Fehren 1" /LENGTH=60 /DNA_ID=CAMNT_0010730499 /DNA_START=815 /DNA_END=997 /DNA_ORIENTATION=-
MFGTPKLKKAKSKHSAGGGSTTGSRILTSNQMSTDEAGLTSLKKSRAAETSAAKSDYDEP